ncbi:zinc finger, C3HC4 type domain-containing protein [Babesia caballi]|uniref:Zinc finger, C3HC4 type domain-containing protein n=1 Tax=Babesia caballi TaxID=5871 RepID=A0AAV4LSE1_BABCB|nr:zinc finger, C3HC4 type domain-containing protein [Babesia caballi]
MDGSAASEEPRAAPREEVDLTRPLRFRRWPIPPLAEFLIGAEAYRQRRRPRRSFGNSMLADFVVLDPPMAIRFTIRAILSGIVMNALLCVPHIDPSSYDAVHSSFASKAVTWVRVSTLLQVVHIPIRSVLLLAVWLVGRGTHQEMMYCMNVLTTCRLWSWSKHLLLLNYFWYMYGLYLVRQEQGIGKTKVFFVTFYVFIIVTVRILFTFALFYLSYPSVSRRSRPVYSTADIPKQLPARLYSEISETFTATCGICLDHFKLDARLRNLPCKHAFHVGCIDEWLSFSRRCPMCNSVAI